MRRGTRRFFTLEKMKANFYRVMKQIDMGSYPLNGEYDDNLMEYYDFDQFVPHAGASI